MKQLYLLCSILLFVALAPLPYGYYTLLRIVVTIGAVMGIVLEKDKGNSLWLIAFGIIAVLFNPLIPVFLNDKSIWMPIDFVAGVVFLGYALGLKVK